MSYEVNVVAFNKEKDLAILEFIGNENKDELDDKLKNDILKQNGAEALRLAHGKDLKSKDTLASIGNPLGFPFEVFINKFEKTQDSGDVVDVSLANFAGIKYKADPRFQILSLFWRAETGEHHNKGEVLWGMSGGPVINLDSSGKPMLVGINTLKLSKSDQLPEKIFGDENNRAKVGKKVNEDFGLGVSAIEISGFIKEYNYILENNKKGTDKNEY
jgi:S1-C subfamily serine protease